MIHGGQLQEAKRNFPHVHSSWIDLSTGISPYAYPFSSILKTSWSQLPNLEDEEKLRAVAAKSYGVKDILFVAVAPGTQILISLLPYLFKAKQVCILCPTYMEHIITWQQVGLPLYQVTSIEDFIKFGSQYQTVGVICNPNNPDGRLLSVNQMHDIVNYWGIHNNHLVVDEAFMDFEEQGIGGLLPHPALTILRSFGKTYGLAGVRLGFLLSSAEHIQQIRQMLGPWSISGAAIHIGIQALSDRTWLLETQKQLASSVEQLDQLFLQNGCQIIGGTHLFRLVEYDKAQELWHYLANHGLWVRKFEYNARWLRFGLPHNKEWDRVKKTIQGYFEEG